MPDFPSQPTLPLFVNTFTQYSAFFDFTRATGQAAGPASVTWPLANMAMYVPVWLPWAYPVARVYWMVGTANTSAHTDFGIYTADGTQIYHTGSTAQGTVSTVQYVSPTAFTLAPGRYYFGMSVDVTTANCGCQGLTVGTALRYRLAGLLQQASAHPLPATMTGALVANVVYPFCGITRTASGF